MESLGSTKVFIELEFFDFLGLLLSNDLFSGEECVEDGGEYV